MSQLEPCPQCQRHLRTAETTCPFCSFDVSHAMATAPRRALPSRRLSRAALLALSMGAGVAAAGLEGCADDVEQAAAESAADELASEQAAAAPVYGGPFVPVKPPPVKQRDAGAPEEPAASDAGSGQAQGDAGGLDAGAPVRPVRPPRDPRDRPPSGGTIRPVYGAPVALRAEEK